MRAAARCTALLLALSLLVGCSPAAPERPAEQGAGPLTTLPEDGQMYRSTLAEPEQAEYDRIRAALLARAQSAELETGPDDQRLMELVRMVLADDPQLCWVDATVTCQLDPSGAARRMEPCYNELAGDVPGALAELQQAAAPVVEQLRLLPEDGQRIAFAHDWLVQNVQYDPGAGDRFSAYPALVQGRAVCMGYASAFCWLMQQVQIPSAVVMGWAENGSGSGEHVWNLVQLEGAWYGVDVTWDDPVGRRDPEPSREYFLLTAEQMARHHRRDAISARLPAESSTPAAATAAE